MSIYKTEISRVCCDICGAPFIVDGERWIPDTTFGSCYECQGYLSDKKLENPDEWYDDNGRKTCLNYDRFSYLWNLKMLRKKGFPRGLAAYKAWREAHPELGKRFDMCNFQEVPGIEEKIAELWGVVDEEDE